jgi:hypothetical protein
MVAGVAFLLSQLLDKIRFSEKNDERPETAKRKD